MPTILPVSCAVKDQSGALTVSKYGAKTGFRYENPRIGEIAALFRIDIKPFEMRD